MRRNIVIILLGMGAILILLAVSLASVGTEMDQLRIEREDLQVETDDLQQAVEQSAAGRTADDPYTRGLGGAARPA